MFNVYLDGVYDSTHQTFTSACRYARQQAVKNQQSYYTVFEAGDEGEEMMLLDGERATLQGVPDYIIAPHVVTMQTDTVTESRACQTCKPDCRIRQTYSGTLNKTISIKG
ncbi:MAG: hypothetical protein R3E93_07260 [Thiothrix sp.]